MTHFKDNNQIISKEETGIYIHIPFCRKKCIYCDFYSGGGKGTDWRRFTRSLLNELDERKGELGKCPDTLYIGGGTPSLMPAQDFTHLINEIRRITGKQNAWLEFTIEVNPEDVTEETCMIWRDCGVNRVSMGVQTLNDNELKKIGRNHDSDTALRAMDVLRRNFNNYTVDLIFGLPGQSTITWVDTVEKILSKRPDHISAYSLMFEEGTAMTLLKKQGRMTFPSDEECLEMWSYLQEELEKAGYVQYEISNYALPGKESRHNRKYWLGNPYLGLGPSAHSYDGSVIRRANRNDIKAYMDFFCDRRSSIEEAPERRVFYSEETLGEEELMEEMVMLSMRTSNGLDMEDYRRRFGEEAYGRLMRNVERLLNVGIVEKRTERLRLSKDGMRLADEAILQLCM